MKKNIVRIAIRGDGSFGPTKAGAPTSEAGAGGCRVTVTVSSTGALSSSAKVAVPDALRHIAAAASFFVGGQVANPTLMPLRPGMVVRVTNISGKEVPYFAIYLGEKNDIVFTTIFDDHDELATDTIPRNQYRLTEVRGFSNADGLAFAWFISHIGQETSIRLSSDRRLEFLSAKRFEEVKKLVEDKYPNDHESHVFLERIERALAAKSGDRSA